MAVYTIKPDYTLQRMAVNLLGNYIGQAMQRTQQAKEVEAQRSLLSDLWNRAGQGNPGAPEPQVQVQGDAANDESWSRLWDQTAGASQPVTQRDLMSMALQHPAFSRLGADKVQDMVGSVYGSIQGQQAQRSKQDWLARLQSAKTPEERYALFEEGRAMGFDPDAPHQAFTHAFPHQEYNETDLGDRVAGTSFDPGTGRLASLFEAGKGISPDTRYKEDQGTLRERIDQAGQTQRERMSQTGQNYRKTLPTYHDYDTGGAVGGVAFYPGQGKIASLFEMEKAPNPTNVYQADSRLEQEKARQEGQTQRAEIRAASGGKGATAKDLTFDISDEVESAIADAVEIAQKDHEFSFKDDAPAPDYDEIRRKAAEDTITRLRALHRDNPNINWDNIYAAYGMEPPSGLETVPFEGPGNLNDLWGSWSQYVPAGGTPGQSQAQAPQTMPDNGNGQKKPDKTAPQQTPKTTSAVNPETERMLELSGIGEDTIRRMMASTGKSRGEVVNYVAQKILSGAK